MEARSIDSINGNYAGPISSNTIPRSPKQSFKGSPKVRWRCWVESQRLSKRSRRSTQVNKSLLSPMQGSLKQSVPKQIIEKQRGLFPCILKQRRVYPSYQAIVL